METSDFQHYIELCKLKFQHIQTHSKRWDDLETVELLENQAFYVLDWRTGKVTFSKGIEKLLGHSGISLTFLDLTQHLIHPEDKEKLGMLVKEVSTYCLENEVGTSGVFRLSYRIRKIDGVYIKVMRHTGTYELDDQGRMLSNFTFLSDISNFDHTSKLNWDFSMDGFDLTEIKKNIALSIQTKISEREREILECLSRGLTGKEIADGLCISAETVKSHRKNLFQKFFVNNTIDLLKKADLEGIINL